MSYSESQPSVTLRGSTEVVSDFFVYSVNSILYQRGIYPAEQFSRVNKYGLTILVTNDNELNKYLHSVLGQLKEWTLQSKVQKLVLVICSVETGRVLERWQFNIEITNNKDNYNSNVDSDEQQIVSQIQAVIRQITASVTFLPLLDEPCTFDMLIYTDVDVQIPETWEESDPKIIINQKEVKLRSFTTKVHKVETMVSYATDIH
ncbi:mitotic spindle assembly checkpoint protein MAD2 isoform 2 [Galdieria sulphuraria]|uniref:Mitotic spindle assembly checkpoint protein MAD2 isoform 2 n=1 Tax=Galdieria sulphuraria TaxID=130081 RepID=M2Y5R9_GALSU|nr:mitotic spindle assembly checkpoint protein MAD2 isoform 2 [Galdieria sulphuraria]EME31308.1 mitotic spindle assembly checkpoint protein MAD2 isoform 2 [Galdieria sulphuraria]|eukprot:XP_005707828.1 mitotic spindle assembly checkpoint protein MAD2 isoform 2 [Galdieria sulphuraria]